MSRTNLKYPFSSLLVWIMFFVHAYAYVGNTGELGSITVVLEKPPKITATDLPVEVTTVFENRGNETVSLNFVYRTIETLEFSESDTDDKRQLRASLDVPGGKSLSYKTEILARPGTYNAHYPISLDVEAMTDGRIERIHVVHPIETSVGPNPDWKPVMTLPDNIVRQWPKDEHSSGKTDPNHALPLTLFYDLGDDRRCSVVFGQKGILDGSIALIVGEKSVVFKGLRIWIAGRPLSELVDKTPRHERAEPNDYITQRWCYDIEIEGKQTKVFFEIRHDGEAIRFSVHSREPGLITGIEFGPADRTADRVYFGHGYMVERPGAFQVGANGHRLSTSHVGFDFENDISLVMATTTFPEYLKVDPETKTYTLGTRPETTFTLLPGDRNDGGAFACAVRYRKYTDKKPAPGVSSKAGRFVVDIWNGLYREHAELIRRAAEYGLRDDLIFLSHNWQRYKYDHRLPDVWPPNPVFGTLGEMKDAMKAAHGNGWLFGVHLNCIDYYPDSSVFTFDDVSFHRNGTPRKAYLNVMLDAQSYQLRPDRAADVLDLSIREMLREFPISVAFVDVLAANAPNEFYDRTGRYHSRIQALDGWMGVFEMLHDRMKTAGPASADSVGKRPARKSDGSPIVFPTISEGGDDFLAGKLDGADCQLLYLSREPGEYRWMRIPEFENAVAVPWFDVVNHTNFSLHGAGYSIRYEGGRGRELHGIDSDDYIGTEIQFGHAPMTDGACRDVKEILGGAVRNMDVDEALRATVRKYWLSHPVARMLAAHSIRKVDFIGGDIHRQRIEWSNDTVVYINRGESDWVVDGIVLPQYGYRAVNTSIHFGPEPWLDSTICRIDDHVVERTVSRTNDSLVWYFNPRKKPLSGLIPATPRVSGFEYAGESRFRLPILWTVRENANDFPVKDYRLILHLVKPKNTEASSGKDDVIGYARAESVTKWKKGEILSETKSLAGDTILSIPDHFPNGIYDVLVSADDPEAPGDFHRRGKMFATPSFWYRYRLGRLTVNRDKETGHVTNLSFEKAADADVLLYERLLPPEKPIDFGTCKTTGAFRISSNFDRNRFTLTPLPGEEPMVVELNLSGLGLSGVDKIPVDVIDSKGKILRTFEPEIKAGTITLETRINEFAYVLRPEKPPFDNVSVRGNL